MKTVMRVQNEDGKILEVLELEDDKRASAGDGESIVDIEGEELIARARSGYWRHGGKFGTTEIKLLELPFKAMLLDDAGILLAIEELQSSAELTELHVDLRPLGGACDREPGRYRWDREKLQLVPLKRGEQLSAPAGVSLEAAFAQFLEKNPQLEQGDRTMVWLAGYRGSVDAFKGGNRK